MATGRIGALDMSATTYQLLYTVPASTFTVATVSFCNRSASTVSVRLAVTTASTAPPTAPANTEFLEYDAQILANGVLERTGIVLDTGKILSVYSSATSVSCVAMGIETTTA
jgi:hypothetical protein